jgi:NAD+ kinase
MADTFDRIGLVTHPSREVGRATATLAAWAERQGAELVRLAAGRSDGGVAPPGDAAACDLLVALGGDGTTLAALHAAADARRPVLGVACGSLGALTAVTAERLDAALERLATGFFPTRSLPGLMVTGDVAEPLVAFNDLVLVRRGAGQVIVHLAVRGERVARFAGDGLVVATPLGSTGYTLAAGGPVLAPEAQDLATTPLAPHGGCCPPVVTPAGQELAVTLEPGYGGARVEIDGRPRGVVEPPEPARFTITLEPDAATLVVLDDAESVWAALRRRRIVIDSPRVLARDDREAARARQTAPDRDAGR